jgi:hypothetical protein
MDQKVKEKWVKALKSGKYKQTKGQLKNRDSYCCLGVYCKITNKRISMDGMGLIVNNENTNYTPLEKEIGRENVGNLWRLNDDEKLTFPEIALYIENGL